ncbi:MAG: TonB-dependent receptor, partial [Gemmatimonadetes bacterium]
LDLDGSFDFELAPEVGGGAGRRRNTDVSRRSARFGLTAPLAGGDLQATAAFEALRRGLPGKSFAPSDSARQRLHRLRASSVWSGALGGAAADATAYATWQRVETADPTPPFGLPFDERATLVQVGLRTSARGGLGPAAQWTASFDVDRLAYEATSLAAGAPDGRTDVGGSIGLMLRPGPGGAELGATVRAQWDGLAGRLRWTHELAARVRTGPVGWRVAHRSAYAPPTFGDQFFREGVAVRSNPDLAAERVPSEVEVGFDVPLSGAWGSLRLQGSAFTGDVRGMIVWLPDFRFVWSPRNTDVRRRGAELAVEAGLPRWGVEASAAYTYARLVYDRAGPAVQVAYRPRHSGRVEVRVARAGFRVRLASRYTGARFPVPNAVNALPGFVATDLSVERAVRIGRAEVRVSALVDRLFDRREALVFAYPDPGRTLRFALRVRRASTP